MNKNEYWKIKATNKKENSINFLSIYISNSKKLKKINLNNKNKKKVI